MEKPTPATLNEALGTEIVSLGLFVQTSEINLGSAVGFVKYEGQEYVVKVEILDPLDAFGPDVDF